MSMLLSSLICYMILYYSIMLYAICYRGTLGHVGLMRSDTMGYVWVIFTIGYYTFQYFAGNFSGIISYNRRYGY